MTPRPWIAGAPPPVAVMGLFLVLGAGCAPRPAHPPRTPSASSRPAAGSAPAAASTAHNWAYRVGQAYAYRGEPSPDGAAPGASAVQLYRYLGDRGGVFALQFDGETATCAVPCQTIYIHAGAFHVERIAFDPDTLIGAAFTDAFNGQLAVYDPAKAAGPHR